MPKIGSEFLEVVVTVRVGDNLAFKQEGHVKALPGELPDAALEGHLKAKVLALTSPMRLVEPEKHRAAFKSALEEAAKAKAAELEAAKAKVEGAES